MFEEQIIPPIDSLPGVFRILSTSCVPSSNGRGVVYRVELYHDKARMTVSFARAHPDIRMRVDQLASVRWKMPVVCNGGAIQISRLVLLEHPIKDINLFEMVPPSWVKDRELVNRAKKLLDNLPDNLRQLVTAILWDGSRFRRFCDRPASIRGHHAYRSGNLRHTVEVGESVSLLASQYPLANVGISLAAAILHDAGKAAEYDSWGNNGWSMTDRGKLVGHRHTVLEWIAVASAMNRIMLSENHYLSLLHALTSAPNAEWLGIRTPVTPEATLLSMAGRLSGESALLAQLAPRDGEWGSQHHHGKGNPVTLPVDELSAVLSAQQ